MPTDDRLEILQFPASVSSGAQVKLVLSYDSAGPGEIELSVTSGWHIDPEVLSIPGPVRNGRLETDVEVTGPRGGVELGGKLRFAEAETRLFELKEAK